MRNQSDPISFVLDLSQLKVETKNRTIDFADCSEGFSEYSLTIGSEY